MKFRLSIIVAAFLFIGAIACSTLFFNSLDSVPFRYIDDLHHYEETESGNTAEISIEYIKNLHTEIREIEVLQMVSLLGYLLSATWLCISLIFWKQERKVLGQTSNKQIQQTR